jgi:putative nucleotidyltransferase with HDIG domain
MVEGMRIGERLVWAQLVTEEQVNEALDVQKKQGGKLVGILINLDYLDEDTFLEFLARNSGVASINIENYEIRKEIVDLVPAELAQRHELLPIDKLGSLLTVAMVCPLDQATLEQLATITGLKIKPVLCSAADVRQAIKRYYAEPAADAEAQPASGDEALACGVPKATFKLTGVTELVKQIVALPTLPAILERVREAVAHPLSSAGDVARVISTDPAIASKLLQVANSAAYGVSRKISDIKEAIAWLGLRETYQVALSIRAIEMFPESEKFDYERFRGHSLQCAAAANVLARRCGAGDKSGIFAAGLLHDIGKLVLVEVMAERYARIVAHVEERGHDIVAVEEEYLGVSHAEIGYLLADHWQFPPEMTQAIRFHHKPELSGPELVFTTIIAFADKISNSIAAGEDTAEFASRWPELLSTLKLSQQDVVEAVREYGTRSDALDLI